MTDNLKKRLVTVLIGVPAVLAGILLLPQYNFIFLSLMLAVCSLIGSFELSKMLFGRAVPASYLSFIYPLITYLCLLFELDSQIPYFVLSTEILTVFAIEIFSGEKDNFESSLTKTASNCLVLIYPSFFLAYLIQLAALDSTEPFVIALFFILVFGNDIFAYVFGMLFGRNNAGFIKASPKKSIAGFAGGTISTLLLALFLAPIENIIVRIILGLLVSLAANIGDLIESVLKRSAKVKDSGNIIPGRGGILDCVDSLSAAAPIFYMFFKLF